MDPLTIDLRLSTILKEDFILIFVLKYDDPVLSPIIDIYNSISERSDEFCSFVEVRSEKKTETKLRVAWTLFILRDLSLQKDSEPLNVGCY